MLRSSKLCIISILIAATLPATQSAFAKLPLGALFHPHPMGHPFGHHPLLKNLGIPKPPASENPGTPIINNLKTMNNVYKMDNKIADASPGIIGAMALRHRQQQAQASSVNSNNVTQVQ